MNTRCGSTARSSQAIRTDCNALSSAQLAATYTEDAEIFAEDLASINIDAFSWTNQPGQAVRKISAQ